MMVVAPCAGPVESLGGGMASPVGPDVVRGILTARSEARKCRIFFTILLFSLFGIFGTQIYWTFRGFDDQQLMDSLDSLERIRHRLAILARRKDLSRGERMERQLIESWMGLLQDPGEVEAKPATAP